MNKVLFPLLLSLSLSLGACGGGSDSDDNSSASSNACEAIGLKIANGDTCAFNDDNPSSSALLRLRITTVNGESGICTGTAITPFKVLTAAHCFLDEPFSIEVDSVYRTVSATTYAVHPSFSFQTRDNGAIVFFNDVAVVTVPTPLLASTLPILIGRDPIVGEEAVIAGFGLTQPGSSVGDLNAGTAEVSSVTPNHVFLTFTGDQSHPCQGDSGGPMLLEHLGTLTIAGVVSQSDPSVDLSRSCLKGDVTLYANTQEAGILSFITQQAPDAVLR